MSLESLAAKNQKGPRCLLRALNFVRNTNGADVSPRCYCIYYYSTTLKIYDEFEGSIFIKSTFSNIHTRRKLFNELAKSSTVE
jgi:hypothetical protein